jgi:hydrogenase maturation factor HypF (carbamoyltransferase family)
MESWSKRKNEQASPAFHMTVNICPTCRINFILVQKNNTETKLGAIEAKIQFLWASQIPR